MLSERELIEIIELAIARKDQVVEKLAFNAVIHYRLAKRCIEDFTGEGEEKRGEVSVNSTADNSKQELYLDAVSGALAEFLDCYPGYRERLDRETESMLPYNV